MGFVDAGSLAALTDGRPHSVSVGGRDIILIQVGESVRALRNICPHESQPLAPGTVEPKPRRGTPPGTIAMCEGRYVVMCPWHKWTFDVDTGICAVDPSYRVRAYPTLIKNGRVLVDMQARVPGVGAE